MVPLILLDVGGSSVRATVVVAPEASPVVVGRRSLRLVGQDRNRLEFDVAGWLRDIAETLGDATAWVNHHSRLHRATLMVTSIRQAFALVADGQPLGPGIMNLDARGEESLPALLASIDESALYERTGHWAHPILTLPKLVWVRHQQPELTHRHPLVAFVHDLVVWYLTGAFVTEQSFLASGQLLDVRSGGAIPHDLLAAADLAWARFPDIAPGGTTVSTIVVDGLVVDVVVGVGDTHLQWIGARRMSDAEPVVLVSGSTGPIQTLLTARATRAGQPWISRVEPGRWMVAETNSGSYGFVVHWLAEWFGRSERVVVELGARGVLDGLPEFGVLTGLRTWEPGEHNRRSPGLYSQTAGAAPELESLARQAMWDHVLNVRTQVNSLCDPDEQLPRPLVVAGGLARSAAYVRCVAGAMEREVRAVDGEALALSGVAELVGSEPPALSVRTVSPPHIDCLPEALAKHRAFHDVTVAEVAGPLRPMVF